MIITIFVSLMASSDSVSLMASSEFPETLLITYRNELTTATLTPSWFFSEAGTAWRRSISRFGCSQELGVGGPIHLA